MKAGEGDQPDDGTGPRVFPFATEYMKGAVLSGAIMLLVFPGFIVPMILSALQRGRDVGGGIGALAMLILGLALLTLYGRYLWTTRIEIDDRSIRSISGSRQFEGSLRDVSALRRFETESGHAYRIEFRNGGRVDFNSGIQNADELCRQIEQAAGLRFTD